MEGARHSRIPPCFKVNALAYQERSLPLLSLQRNFLAVCQVVCKISGSGWAWDFTHYLTYCPVFSILRLPYWIPQPKQKATLCNHSSFLPYQKQNKVANCSHNDRYLLSSLCIVCQMVRLLSWEVATAMLARKEWIRHRYPLTRRCVSISMRCIIRFEREEKRLNEQFASHAWQHRALFRVIVTDG